MSVSFRIPIVFCKLLHLSQRESPTLRNKSPARCSPTNSPTMLRSISWKSGDLQENIPTLNTSFGIVTITTRTIRFSTDNPALRGHPAFYEYNQFTFIPVRLLAIDVTGSYALISLTTGDNVAELNQYNQSLYKTNLQLIHLDCYGSLHDDKDARFSYNLYNNGIYSAYEQSARYLVDSLFTITSANTLVELRNRSASDRFVNEDKRITYLEHVLCTSIKRWVINSTCFLFTIRALSKEYIKSQLQVQSQYFNLSLSPYLSEFEQIRKDFKPSPFLLINPKTIWLLLRDERTILRSLISKNPSLPLTNEEASSLLTADLYSIEAHRLLLLLCPVLPTVFETIISEYLTFYSQAVSYTLMRLCTIDDINEETRVLAPRRTCDLSNISLIIKGLEELLPNNEEYDSTTSLDNILPISSGALTSTQNIGNEDSSTTNVDRHDFYKECLRCGIILYSRETRRIFHSLVGQRARGPTTFSFYSKIAVSLSQNPFKIQHTILSELPRYSYKFIKLSNTFLKLLSRFCAPIPFSIEALLDGFSSSKIILQQYNELFMELESRYKEIGYNFVSIKRQIYDLIKRESTETKSLLKEFSAFPHTVDFLLDPSVLPILRRKTLQSPYIYIEKYIYQRIHLEPPHIYHSLDVVSDEDDDESKPSLQLGGGEHVTVTDVKEAQKSIMKSIVEQRNGSIYADFYYDAPIDSDQYSDALKYALLYSKLFSFFITDVIPLISALFFREFKFNKLPANNKRLENNPILAYETFNHQVVIFLQRTFSEDLDNIQNRFLELCCAEYTYIDENYANNTQSTSSIEAAITTQNVSTIKLDHDPFIKLDFVCFRKPDVFKPYQRKEDLNGLSNMVVGFTVDCVAQITMVRAIVTNLAHSLHRLNTSLEYHLTNNLIFLSKNVVKGYSELPTLKKYCRKLVHKELELIQQDLTSFNIIEPRTFQDRLQREVYLEDIIASRYSDFELAYFEERKRLRLSYAHCLEENFNNITILKELLQKCPPTSMGARTNLLIISYNRQFFQKFDQLLSNIYSTASLCSENITRELERNKLHIIALNNVLRHRYLTASEDTEQIRKLLDKMNSNETNISLPNFIFTPPSFLYRIPAKLVTEEQVDMTNLLHDEIVTFNNPLFSVQLTTGDYLNTYGLCDPTNESLPSTATHTTTQASTTAEDQDSEPGQYSDKSDTVSLTASTQKQSSSKDIHLPDCPFPQLGKVSSEKNLMRKQHRDASPLYVIVDNAVMVITRILSYIRKEILPITPHFYTNIITYNTVLLKKQLINKLIAVIEHVREHVRQTISEVLQTPFTTISLFENRICLDMDTPDNLDLVITGLDDARKFVQGWIPAIKMLIDLLPLLSFIESTASITDVQSLFTYLRVSAELKGEIQDNNQNDALESEGSSDNDNNNDNGKDKDNDANSRAERIREEISADFEHNSQQVTSDMESLHELNIHRHLLQRDLLFVPEDHITFEQMLDHAFDVQLLTRIDKDRAKYERRKARYLRRVAAGQIDPVKIPFEKAVKYQVTLPKVSILVSMRSSQLRIHNYTHNYRITTFIEKFLNFRRLINTCKCNIDRRLQSFSTFIYLSVEYLLYLRQLCISLTNEVTRLTTSDLISSIARPHEFKARYPHLTSNISLNKLEQYFKSQNGEDAYAFIKFVQSHTNLAITRHSSSQRHIITLHTRPTDEYLCNNPLVTDLESFFRFLIKCTYESDEESRSGTIKMNRTSANTLTFKQFAEKKQAGNTSPYYNLYAIFTEVHVIIKESVKIFNAITQWSEILGITLAIEDPSFHDILSVIESPSQLMISITDMFVSYIRIMHQPVTAFNPSLFSTYVDTIFLCSRKMHMAERSGKSTLVHIVSDFMDTHDNYKSEYSYHQSAAQRLIEPSTAEFFINEDYDPQRQVILETSIFTVDDTKSCTNGGLTTNINTPRHEELISKGMSDLDLLLPEEKTQSNTFVTRGMKFVLSLIDGEKTSAGYTLKQQSQMQNIQPSKAQSNSVSIPPILTARIAKQELSVVQEENLDIHGSVTDTSSVPISVTVGQAGTSFHKDDDSLQSPSQSSQIITFNDGLLKQSLNIHEDQGQATCDPPSEISAAQARPLFPGGELSMNSFSIDLSHSARGQVQQNISARGNAPNVLDKQDALEKVASFISTSAIAAGSRLAISNASRASRFILDNSARDALVFTSLSNTGLQSLRDVAMHMNIVKIPTKIKYFKKLYVRQKDVRTVIKMKDNSPDIISAKILETINSFKNTTLFEDCRLECNYSTWIPTLRSLIVTLLLYSIQHFSFLSTVRLLFNSHHFASYFLNQCLEHARVSDEPTTMSPDWKGFSGQTSISVRDSLDLISPFNHQLAHQINKRYLLNYSAENKLLEIYYWLHNIDIFIIHYTINLHLNDEIARVIGDLDMTFGEHEETLDVTIKDIKQPEARAQVAEEQKSSIFLPAKASDAAEETEDANVSGNDAKSDSEATLRDRMYVCTDSSDDDAFDLFETPFGRIDDCASRSTTIPLIKHHAKTLTIAVPRPSIASKGSIAPISHRQENPILGTPKDVKEKSAIIKLSRTRSPSIPKEQKRTQSKILLGNQRKKATVIRKRRSYDGPARVILPFFSTHEYLLKALREAIFVVTTILADKDIIPKVAKMARALEDKLIFCRNLVIAIKNAKNLLPELISLTNAIYDGIVDLPLLKLSLNDVKKVTIEIISCLKHICMFAKSKHEINWSFNVIMKKGIQEPEPIHTISFISFLDNLNLLDRRRCGARSSIPKFYTDEAPSSNCFQFIVLLSREIAAKVHLFIGNVSVAEDLLSRCRHNLSAQPVVTTIFANQQYRICAPYARLPLSFAVIYSQLTTVPLNNTLSDALLNSTFSPLITNDDEIDIDDDSFDDDSNNALNHIECSSQLSYSLLSNLIDSSGSFFGLYKGHENVFYQITIKANARVKDCYIFTDGSLHSQHIIHNYRKAALLLLNERYHEALLFCTYQSIVYALSSIIYLYCDGRAESFIYCYENVICSLMRILEEETYELVKNMGKLKTQGSFQVGSTLSATRSKTLMLKSLYARLLEHKETMDVMIITVVQYILACNILPHEEIPSLTNAFDAQQYWAVILRYGRDSSLVVSGLKQGISLSIATNRQTSALVYSLASDVLLGNGVNRRIDMPLVDLTYTTEERNLIKNAKARLQARIESTNLSGTTSEEIDNKGHQEIKAYDGIPFDDFTALTTEVFKSHESLCKRVHTTISTTNLDDELAYNTPVSSVALNCDSSITDFRMPTTPLSETLVNVVSSGQLVNISTSYFNPANECDCMYMSHTLRLKAARIVSALRSKSVVLFLTDRSRGYTVPEAYYLLHLVSRILSSHILFIPITDSSFSLQYSRLRELLISRHLVVLYGVETLSKKNLNILSNIFWTKTLSYGFEDCSSYSICSETRLEFNSDNRSRASCSSQGWIPIDSNIDHLFCRLIIWLAEAMPHEPSTTSSSIHRYDTNSSRSQSAPQTIDEHYIYQLHPHAERVAQEFPKAYMVYLPFYPYIFMAQSLQEFNPIKLVCTSTNLNDKSTFTKNFLEYKNAILIMYKEHVESLKRHITTWCNKNIGDTCLTISTLRQLFKVSPGCYQDSFYYLHLFLSSLSNEFPNLLTLDFELIQRRLPSNADKITVCTQTFIYLLSCMYLAVDESIYFLDDSSTALFQADCKSSDEIQIGDQNAANKLHSRIKILISSIISIFGLSPANASIFEHLGSHITSDSAANMIRRSSSSTYLKSLHNLQQQTAILSEFGAYIVTVMIDLLAAKEPFAILTTSMARQFFEHLHAIFSKATVLTFLLAYSSADIHFYADLLSAFPNRYVLGVILDQHSDPLLYQNVLGLLGKKQTIYSETNTTYLFKVPIRVVLIARVLDTRVKQLTIRKFSFSRTLHLSDTGFYFMSVGTISRLNIRYLTSIQRPTLINISSYNKIMQYIYANYDVDYNVYTSSPLTRTKLGIYISYFNFLIYVFVTFVSNEISTHIILTLRHWRIIRALIHIFLRYYGIIEVQTGTESQQSSLSNEEELNTDVMNPYHEISIRSHIDTNNPISLKQQKDMRDASSKPLEFSVSDALESHFSYFSEDVSVSRTFTDLQRDSLQSRSSNNDVRHRLSSFEAAYSAALSQTSVQFTQSFISRLLLTSNSRYIVDILHYSVISAVFSSFMLVYRMEYINRGLGFNNRFNYKVYKSLLSYIPTFSLTLEEDFFAQHVFYRKDGFRLNKWMHLCCDNAIVSLQDFYVSQTYFFMSIGSQPTILELSTKKYAESLKSKITDNVGSSVYSSFLNKGTNESEAIIDTQDQRNIARGDPSSRVSSISDSHFPTKAEKQEPNHNFKCIWDNNTYSFMAITSYLSDRLLLTIAKKLGLTIELISELERTSLPQYRKKCIENLTRKADQLNNSRFKDQQTALPTKMSSSLVVEIQKGSQAAYTGLSHRDIKTSILPDDSNMNTGCTDFSTVLWSVASSTCIGKALQRASTRVLTSLEQQSLTTENLFAPPLLQKLPENNLASSGTPKTNTRARMGKLKRLKLDTAEKTPSDTDKHIVSFIRRYIPILEIPYRVGEEIFISSSLLTMQNSYADTTNSLQLVITNDMSAYAVYYAGCMLSGESFTILGDSFSGKTTILQIAASLIGSDSVSFQTFYVGDSNLKTIADLQVAILKRGYLIRPETSKPGNLYVARSVSGKFNILHISGLTHANLSEFLSLPLMERVIYFDVSQRAISKAIGGFCGRIFLHDSVVIYEISSSSVEETAKQLIGMSVYVSTYSATNNPTFLHSLVYRNFVYDHLIQDTYCTMEKSIANYHTIHYDVDDPLTAFTPLSPRFYYPKLFQPVTARVFAARGIKRFPKLSNESIAENMDAIQSDDRPQLSKYAPMSIVIRTLVKSFSEGLLLIKPLLPISLLELLSNIKQNVYFDDADVRNVFGYPPSSFLENLHMLVPSANILFSALLRHGAISISVSARIYSEIVSAFSIGTLSPTSVFSVLVPEYAETFKRMYPFLIPFSYSKDNEVEVIQIMLQFSWEQCLKTVIDSNKVSSISLSTPITSRDPISSSKKSERAPILIFSGDYFTRHKYELQRRSSVFMRKNFRYNKVINIDKLYSVEVLKFTGDLIDELSICEEAIKETPPATVSTTNEKPMNKIEGKKTTTLSTLTKMSKLQNIHLTSMLTRAGLNFDESDSDSDDSDDSDDSLTNANNISMKGDGITKCAQSTTTTNTVIHSTYSDYAQSFLKPGSLNKTKEYSEEEKNKSQEQEESLVKYQETQLPEDGQPSTTIVRLLVKYRDIREVMYIPSHIAIILIRSYLITEVAWHRNCIKIYEYLAALRYGPANGMTQFNQFSRIYNPPEILVSYIQMHNIHDYTEDTHRMLQFIALLGNFKLVNSLDFMGFISGLYYSPHDGNIRIPKDGQRKSIAPGSSPAKSKVKPAKERSVSLLSIHQGMHTNFKIDLLFTRYHRYLINSYQLITMVGLIAIEAETRDIGESIRKSIKPMKSSYYSDSSDEDDFIAQTNPRILRTLKKKSVFNPDSRPFLRDEKPVMTYSGKLSRRDQYYYIFKEVNKYCVEREPINGFVLPLNGIKTDFLADLVGVYRTSKDVSVLTYYIIRAYLLMALGFDPSLGLKDLSLMKIREFYNAETTFGMGVWSLVDSSLVKKHLGKSSIREFFLPEPVDILLVLHSNLIIGRMDILTSIVSLSRTLTAVFSEDEIRFISLIVSCYYELDSLLCDHELIWLLSRNFSILLVNDTIDIPPELLKHFNVLPSIGDQAMQKYALHGTHLNNTDSFSSISFMTNYFGNLEKSLCLMFSSVAEPLLKSFSIMNIRSPCLPKSKSVLMSTPKLHEHQTLSPDSFSEFRGTLIFACTIGYTMCLKYIQANAMDRVLTFGVYTDHVWRFCYLRMGMYTGFTIPLYNLMRNLRSELLKSKLQKANLTFNVTNKTFMQSELNMQGKSKSSTLTTIPEDNASNMSPRKAPKCGSKQNINSYTIQSESIADTTTPRSTIGKFSSRLTDISHKSRNPSKLNSTVLNAQTEHILTILNGIMDEFSAIIRDIIADSVVAVSSLVFKHQILYTLQHGNTLEVLIMNAIVEAGFTDFATANEHSTNADSYLAHISCDATMCDNFQKRSKKDADEVASRSVLEHLFAEIKSTNFERALILALDTFQINLPLLLRYADLALEMRFGMSQDLLNSTLSIEYSRHLLFHISTIHSFLCHTLFSKGQEKLPVLSSSLFLPVLYMAETLRHMEETKKLQHPESAEQIKGAYNFEFLDCSMQHDEFISRVRVALSCSNPVDRPLCFYNMFSASFAANNRSLARLLRSLFTLINSPLPEPDEFGVTKPFHASLNIDDAVQATLTYHPRMRRMYMSLADPYESFYLLEFNYRLHILQSPITTLQYYVGSELETSNATPQSAFSAIDMSLIEKFQRHRQTVLYDYIIEELVIVFTYDAIHLNLPIIRTSQALIEKNKIVDVLVEFNSYLENLSTHKKHLVLEDIEVYLAYIKYIHAEIKRLNEFTIMPLSIKQGIESCARTLLSVYELLWKLSGHLEALSVALTDAFFFSMINSVIKDLQGVDHSALNHRRLFPKHTSEKRITILLPTVLHHLLSKISAIVPQTYMKSLLGMIACLGSISGQSNAHEHMALFSYILNDSLPPKPSNFLGAKQTIDSFLPDIADSLAIERWNKLCSLVDIAPNLIKEWVAFFSTHKTHYLMCVRGSSFFKKVLGHYAYIERSSKRGSRLLTVSYLVPHDILKSAAYEYNIVELFGGFTTETGTVPSWNNHANKISVYGSGTVPIKEPVANTRPGDYNSYRIVDKKTIAADDDSSSELSMDSLDEEDYDVIFDYEYLDDKCASSNPQTKTVSKIRKHTSVSSRSMTVLLKKVEMANLSMQDKGHCANSEYRSESDDKDTSQYEALIPDDLILELKECMVLGNFPISIQTPSINGVWMAFLLSICLNPTHLQEDLDLLIKVNKLTNSDNFSTVDPAGSDRDDELLSKLLQCPPKSLSGSINKFISAFYRAQLLSKYCFVAEKPSYSTFFNDDGHPLSSTSKQSLLGELQSAQASKTLAVFFDSTLDILTIVSFALEYLVDQILLTAPIVYKTRPTHNDLLSYLVIVLSDGNDAVKWLVQSFISKPIRPKYGLIVLIPTYNSAPTLSRVLISHFCTAFVPEVIAFNAPINKDEKIRHYFTLFRILQVSFATKYSIDKALALEDGTLKLLVISSRALLGLFIFLITQNLSSDQAFIRICDTYMNLDSIATFLFQTLLESDHTQALISAVQARLRVHPATIEKIQALYVVIRTTISAIRRYDPERALYHPLNHRLSHLSDQLLVSYARMFHRPNYLSIYEKIYTSPGLLVQSRFLKYCIFALCHELHDKVTLGHTIVVEMPKGSTVNDDALSKVDTGSDSDQSEQCSFVTNHSTSMYIERSQKLSNIITLESNMQNSTELTTVHSTDEITRTSQQSEVDASQNLIMEFRRLESDPHLTLKETSTYKGTVHVFEKDMRKIIDNSLQLEDSLREFKGYGPSIQLQQLQCAIFSEVEGYCQSRREGSGEQLMDSLTTYIEEAQKLSQSNIQLPCVIAGERKAGSSIAFKELCERYLYSLTLYSSDRRLTALQIKSLIQENGDSSPAYHFATQSLITIKELRPSPGLRSTAFTGSTDILNKVSIQTSSSTYAHVSTENDTRSYVINSLLANAIMIAKPIADLDTSIIEYEGVLVCDANQCWRFLEFILTIKRQEAARNNIPYASICSILLPDPPQPNVSYIVYNGMLYTGIVPDTMEATYDLSRLGHVHIKNVELHNIGYDTHNRSIMDCSVDPWPIVYKMNVYAAIAIRVDTWSAQSLSFRSASPKYIAVRAGFAADIYLYLENKSSLSRTELSKRGLYLSPASQK